MDLRLGDGVYFVVLYKVLQRVFRTLRSATFFLFRKKEGKMRLLQRAYARSRARGNPISIRIRIVARC